MLALSLFFCIQLPLFCTVLRKNCTVLSQSESSNFVIYIIRSKNRKIVPYHGCARIPSQGAYLAPIRPPSLIMAPGEDPFLLGQKVPLAPPVIVFHNSTPKIGFVTSRSRDPYEKRTSWTIMSKYQNSTGPCMSITTRFG